jgi:ABC-type Fe3+ transport system permease subunit
MKIIFNKEDEKEYEIIMISLIYAGLIISYCFISCLIGLGLYYFVIGMEENLTTNEIITTNSFILSFLGCLISIIFSPLLMVISRISRDKK